MGPTAGRCSAPTVTCTDAGRAAAGASATIRTTVNAGVTLPITNAANATRGNDHRRCVNGTAGSLSDNTATVTTSGDGSGFDLVLSVVTDNRIGLAGQVLKYRRRGQRRHGSRERRQGRDHIPSGGVLFERGRRERLQLRRARVERDHLPATCRGGGDDSLSGSRCCCRSAGRRGDRNR
jgi:hypothetical protein